MFEAGATILNNGVTVKADYDSAANDFRETLKKAAAENRKPVEFFTEIDTACYEKQRRHGMSMLKKSGEIGRAQEPYFTHQLTHGEVSADAIVKRQEFIRSQPGVFVEDGKDSVVYSFSRQIGEASEIARHVFTKEGHPAHPGVVFLLSRRDKAGSTPTNTNAASHAGSKKEFNSFYTAVALMNRWRFK